MRLPFVLCFVLLYAFSASGQIICGDKVSRGDPHLLIIPSFYEVDSVRVSLSNRRHGEVLQGKGFLIGRTDSGPVYGAFLGIPSNFEEGDYTVTAKGEREDFVFRYTRSLSVLGKKFPAEIIPLSEDLTELFTREDPRKIVEAEKLEEIVILFDAQALYHRTTFILPVKQDKPTAGFGDVRRYVFVDGHVAYGMHRGIDFGLAEGTPVYACASGRVVMSSRRIMTGNTIVIEHLPGVYSLYFHLRDMSVQAGNYVTVGEEIGRVGSTGLSTAAHLHWEIRVGGVAVDPKAFIREGTVDMDLLSEVH